MASPATSDRFRMLRPAGRFGIVADTFVSVRDAMRAVGVSGPVFRIPH